VVFPDQLDVAHQAWHHHHVPVAVADHLEGDVDAVAGLGVTGLRDRIAPVAGARAALSRAVQRGILAQDAAVQLAQLRSGLDRHLGDQDVAQLPVGAQRVGLPPGPVEGEHPQGPEALPERMRRGERFQLRDEIPVPAARQQRLGPRFERGQAFLLQPACLRASGRHRIEIVQRGPAPQAQGLIEGPRRGGGVAGRQRRAALGGQLLEPQRVQFPRLHPQQVTRRPSGQPVGLPGRPERLTQLGQADLQAVGRLVGRLAGPQLLDQPVGRDHLVGAHQEQGQHRPGPGARQRQGLAAGRHLERTEHSELHPDPIHPGAGKSTVSPP
jgi:hypothetical protein